MAQPVEPLPHRDAVLQEKAADLIDDRGSLPHQAVAHTMQRLQIELFVRFWRDAPRRGTLHGFSDRMRVSKVVFVSLPERLGVDRRHLPHVVAEGEQLTGHIVCSHACLYPDQAWRHIREPRHNFGARYLLAQHDPSSCIEANQVQCILARIDTNGDDCGVSLRHGMVLLLLLPRTSMLARRAGARPVHPILRHRVSGWWVPFALVGRSQGAMLWLFHAPKLTEG